MELAGLLLSVVVFATCFAIGWFFLDHSLYHNLDEKDLNVQVGR